MKGKVEFLFLQLWYPGQLTTIFLPRSIRVVFGKNLYLISLLQIRSHKHRIGIYAHGKLQLPTYSCRLIYTVVATQVLPSSFTDIAREGRGLRYRVDSKPRKPRK